MLHQSGWRPWPQQEPDCEQWTRELRSAGKIQAALLEARSIQLCGASALGYSVPRYIVGGDYFDLQHLAGDRLRITVGDVMGKGFGAAMVMTMVRATVRLAGAECPGPGQLLRRVNDFLHADLQKLASFVTLSCADYDPISRTVTVASAGAPFPFLLRAGGGIERIPARGVSVGLMADRFYLEQTFSVQGGDRLLLATDGIMEVRSRSGQELTANGFEQMLRAAQGLPTAALIQHVLDGVILHAAETAIQDDVTMVAVDFHPEGERPCARTAGF